MRDASKKEKMSWKYIILFMLTLVIISLDQLTKYWVVVKFRLGETVPVIPGFFNLTYVQNKGAAFGILAQANPAFRVPFFIIVPLVALASIAYIFRKIPKTDIRLSAALSLVVAGAVGNLIDRIAVGYVIDFLDFHWQWQYHFPAFNVADSAICVGVGLVILDLFYAEKDSPLKKETRTNASSAH